MKTFALSIIGIAVVVLLTLYFMSPPVPDLWKKVTIGMTRSQAYEALHWPHSCIRGKVSIDRDSWYYPVYTHFADKKITITYASDIVSDIAIADDYSLTSWIERCSSSFR